MSSNNLKKSLNLEQQLKNLDNSNQIQQVKSVGNQRRPVSLSPNLISASNARALSQPVHVTNVRARIVEANDTTSKITVSFKRDPGDYFHENAVVYVSGYKGNPAPVQMASGQSPISFALENTGEPVSIKVQSNGKLGPAPLETAPNATLALRYTPLATVATPGGTGTIQPTPPPSGSGALLIDWSPNLTTGPNYMIPTGDAFPNTPPPQVAGSALVGTTSGLLTHGGYGQWGGGYDYWWGQTVVTKGYTWRGIFAFDTLDTIANTDIESKWGVANGGNWTGTDSYIGFSLVMHGSWGTIHCRVGSGNSGGTSTDYNTGIVVADKVNIDCKFIVANNGSKVDFYINGVLVYTDSTTTDLQYAVTTGLPMFVIHQSTNPTISLPAIMIIGSDLTIHQGDSTSNGSITEDQLLLSDVTTDNVTSAMHGFAPKSPADATKFLNGAATPSYAAVTDADLSVSDITTNNVSTSAHGFAPKAPNDATKYLDGTGAYSVPASSGTNVSVDTHPGSPTTYDDEFEAGSLSVQWSWLNQGSASETLKSGSVIMTSPRDGQEHALIETIPATPYTFVMKIGSAWSNIGTSHPFIGFVLQESSSSKLLLFGIDFSAATFAAYTFTNPSTFNSTLFSAAYNAQPQGWNYLRVSDSGTTITFDASSDGLTFVTIGTTTHTGGGFLTSGADHIGLTGSSGSGGTFQFAVDWFRRTA